MNKITVYKNTRDALNSVGPGMCLAKWYQVTLHLHNGHTHSCHHPNTHKVPVEELIGNPSALHNTKFKKEQRKIMLDGGRPSECHYCWNIEDSTPTDKNEVFSDRTYKSAEPWAGEQRFHQTVKAPFDENVNPSYLEVSFSYACNFKCSYCKPNISSSWMEEVKEHGGYPTSIRYNDLEHVKYQDKMPLAEREDNPYVDAFWQWWPDLYPTLHTFRITGGEPLMTKHTFRVLDYIIEHPNKNLDLAINSNCVVPGKLFDKFLEKIKVILDNKSVKRFTLYTSAEAYDAKAEYIRHGLDYNAWIENCSKYLELVPSGNFTIMSTYNALSVTSYVDFLKDVLLLKLKYHKPDRVINIDIPYLNHPEWMSIRILPIKYKEYIHKQVKFMKDNHCNGLGFQSYEIEKLDRIQYLLEEVQDTVLQKDFVLFFDEHDRRRGTNFLKTFPELEEFYYYCKSL
jgi:organic radical activating enzyme